MNSTPRSSRLHIAIFGRRNAGKSSLINALTNQELAIVSDIAGTTTDPVYKAMEILPVGPVVLVDTAGIDDEGTLGEMRVKKTIKVLDKADLVLLVMDPDAGIGEYEKDIVQKAAENEVPVIGVANKMDLYPGFDGGRWELELGITVYRVSSVTREGVEEVKHGIIRHAPGDWSGGTIIGDKLEEGDTVVLVVPVDKAAPRGRLILPQVQTLRDVLDHNAQALVSKETELDAALHKLVNPPKMVITDSQVFKKVAGIVPGNITLTSFSILYARFKGDLETLVAGARSVENLRPGDKVLVAEACTHHRTTDDIGTVKIPRWLEQKVGGSLDFTWASGINLPENLEQFQLVVHCGACMINRREMISRLMDCRQAGVPVVNYGVIIAYLLGILPRVLSPFPEAQAVLSGHNNGGGEEERAQPFSGKSE